MKTFNTPVIEVLKFDVEDIITVSEDLGGNGGNNDLPDDRD